MAGTLLKVASSAFFQTGERATRAAPDLCFRQDGPFPLKRAFLSNELLPNSALWHLGLADFSAAWSETQSASWRVRLDPGFCTP